MRVAKLLLMLSFVVGTLPATTGCTTQAQARAPKARACPYRRNHTRRVPYKRGPMKR